MCIILNEARKMFPCSCEEPVIKHMAAYNSPTSIPYNIELDILDCDSLNEDLTNVLKQDIEESREL